MPSKFVVTRVTVRNGHEIECGAFNMQDAVNMAEDLKTSHPEDEFYVYQLVGTVRTSRAVFEPVNLSEVKETYDGTKNSFVSNQK